MKFFTTVCRYVVVLCLGLCLRVHSNSCTSTCLPLEEKGENVVSGRCGDCVSACNRRWVMPLAGYYNFGSKGLDSCGKTTPLSSLLFSIPGNTCVPLCGSQATGSFTIGDVFLLARLSRQGKLDLNLAPNPNPQFGNAPTEQYLYYAADAQIFTSSQASEAGANLGLFYRFAWEHGTKLETVIGCNIPVKQIMHALDFQVVGPNLYKAGYTQNIDLRETTITRFFADFTDLTSLLYHAVLAPNDITFTPNQRTAGFGDLTFLMSVDAANYFTHVDSLQFGFNFILPTSNRPAGKTLWEPVLGNGGATMMEFFANTIIDGRNNWFNPTTYIGGSWGLGSFTSRGVQLPRLVTNTSYKRVTEISGLSTPVFTQYYAQPFAELDTKVALFAPAITAKVKAGGKFFLGLGNYFYNVFYSCLRLAAYYDFTRQSRGTVVPTCPTDTTVQTNYYCAAGPLKTHKVSWALTYKTDNRCDQMNGLEFSIGGNHTVAGRNVPKVNEIICSLMFAF